MKNFTKYLLLAGLFLALSFSAFAQKPGTKSSKPTSKIGTPEYLLVKRGFKIFKLGTPIEQYKKYIQLVSNDEDNKKYIIIDPKFLTVGDDIKLDKIILTTIKARLKGVTVVVDSMYKRQFLSVLRAAYGNHGITYSVDLWIANNIILRYGPYNNGSKQIIGKSAAYFDDANIK